MRKKAKAQGTQNEAQIATLAQQAMQPKALPDPEDASILDRIKQNENAARKRMGRTSTLTVGATEKPMTAVKTLAGGGY